MSCAVVSVNRALGVLGVVWVLMPVAAVPIDTKPATEDERALPVVLELETEGETISRPQAEEQPLTSHLDEAEARGSPRSDGPFLQPKRKKARVTNGR